jgi:hypothetical protein
MDFYDKSGSARVHTDGTGTLFNWNGAAIGFVRRDAVHDLQGRTVARLQGDWIRDLGGNAVLFGDAPMGGPVPPERLASPAKAATQAKRSLPIPGMPPMPRTPSLSWSVRDVDELFR